ncbi:MAG: hypothetical protein C4324_06770 [Blastocatellia bacterium]
MIKAILCDFNGVIIDDELIQHRAYREVFAPLGIDVTDEMYYARLGMDDKSFVGSILTEAGRESDTDTILNLTAAKTSYWRAIVMENLPLFPGIENFLRKMAREFTLGIVSMAKREEIDFVLEAAGISSLFQVIISAETVTKYKPNPECYRIGFREIDAARIGDGHLPMTHQECLVIEDTPAGVLAARAADLPVLAVHNTVPAVEMRKAGAAAVANYLDDWMPDSIRRVFA